MMPQEPPAAVVPPGLARQLVDAAVLGLAQMARRDAGGAVTPGLTALLRQLDASATRHPVGNLDATRWITVAEAAGLAGLTERSVQRLARNGRLIARRHGHRVWQVDEASARDYGRTTRT